MLPLKGALLEPLPAMYRPPSAAEPSVTVRRISYTVRRGDTLPAIALRYRVSADDLHRWNHIGRLSAGPRLVIDVRQTAPSKRAKSGKKNHIIQAKQ